MGLTPIEEGLSLMLVGMGTVFLFLTVLVLATTAMSKLVARFTPVLTDSPGAEGAVRPEEVAAITAAIAQHRRRGTIE